ncbi:hypothetical protein FKM82_003707 [Ascaphus truei]
MRLFHQLRTIVMFWCILLFILTSRCSASCGTSEGFVADVLNTKLDEITEFPWLASVQDDSGSHLVVGTIISDSWIVTAPSGLKIRKNLVGVVGVTELGAQEVAKNKYYPIRKVVVHERFDEVLLGNDVMLLMTEHKITFGQWVQPVCFPKRDPDNSAYSNCQVSGWSGAAAEDRKQWFGGLAQTIGGEH